MDSILTSIKLLLDITEDCKDFDKQLVMHINSVFMILTQMGVGPIEGFRIRDEFATWDNFITDEEQLDAVISYMYLKVKLLFDSQSMTSPLIESTNRLIAELEWRLNAAADKT